MEILICKPYFPPTEYGFGEEILCIFDFFSKVLYLSFKGVGGRGEEGTYNTAYQNSQIYVELRAVVIPSVLFLLQKHFKVTLRTIRLEIFDSSFCSVEVV